MNSALTRLHIHERQEGFRGNFQAGVSLHCHTYHSKEVLSFIPRYTARVPILSRLFKNELERYLTLHGSLIDFGLAYWTPPLSPRQVYELETLQIEKELYLPALVSITDHDDIEAGRHLQVLDGANRVPISLEWTVPYGAGFFHLGVHNLPPETVTETTRELKKYTEQAPDARPLGDLLALLNESAETLIVLNHPLWDIESIGAQQHAGALKGFLEEHRNWIHALEINGFRSWRENQAVKQLAEDLGLPAVSGGDRHGCQPNTMLNLTQAGTFRDFVAEIREDAHSEVLVMPKYRESTIARMFEVVAEVLNNYPHHPLAQTKWTDRVFIDRSDGLGAQPLSRYWKIGGPRWVRASLWCLRMLGSHQIQSALRLALAHEKVPAERVSYES
ncbi:MAG TPA: hypothetical protein VJ302_36690 [Blastocatellia bacterium]|nr:hypothetical protein [Blastocatellia bacterium]